MRKLPTPTPLFLLCAAHFLILSSCSTVSAMRAPAQTAAGSRYGVLAEGYHSYVEAKTLLMASQNPCLPALVELKKSGIDLTDLFIITDPGLGGWADVVSGTQTAVLSCSDLNRQTLQKMVDEKIWDSTAVAGKEIRFWGSTGRFTSDAEEVLKISHHLTNEFTPESKDKAVCNGRYLWIHGFGVYGENRDAILAQMPSILKSYPKHGTCAE